MNKKLGLIITGIVTVAIIATVGGWLESSNNDGNSSSESGSTPIIQTGIDVMPLTEFNTDTPFENLTIEIEEYFGEHMIYKVTNNSNVCYKYLRGTTYFKSEPLPGRLPLSDDQEYDQSFTFSNVPAYSETYYLERAFSEEMSKDKGASFDGTAYYPFEFGEDPYRIEVKGISNSPSSSIISDVLIQDASDVLVFDRSSFESSSNKLGTIENKSNHIIRFDGFVVFANGKAFKLSNDYDGEGGAYRNYIPAHNQSFELAAGYACEMDTSSFKSEEDYKKNCQPMTIEIDRNTIFADIYESDNYSAIRDFDLYINSWFVDEVVE